MHGDEEMRESRSPTGKKNRLRETLGAAVVEIHKSSNLG